MSGYLLYLLPLCLYVTSIQGENSCCETKIMTGKGTDEECCNGESLVCCETATEFSCCEPPHKKNLREQLQLWGSVAAMVALIGLLFFCCKNDYTLCNGDDRTLAQRLGFRRHMPAMTHLSCPGDRYPSAYTDNNSCYSKLPPLPPMTPYTQDNYGEGGEGKRGMYSPLVNKAGYKGRSNSGYLDDDDDDDYHY